MFSSILYKWKTAELFKCLSPCINLLTTTKYIPNLSHLCKGVENNLSPWHSEFEAKRWMNKQLNEVLESNQIKQCVGFLVNIKADGN